MAKYLHRPQTRHRYADWEANSRRVAASIPERVTEEEQEWIRQRREQEAKQRGEAQFARACEAYKEHCVMRATQAEYNGRDADAEVWTAAAEAVDRGIFVTHPSILTDPYLIRYQSLRATLACQGKAVPYMSKSANPTTLEQITTLLESKSVSKHVMIDGSEGDDNDQIADI
ncbi:MAG: hypothetical protein ACLP56_05410 [Candidatus Sulfotelmatobacter sp.]